MSKILSYFIHWEIEKKNKINKSMYTLANVKNILPKL